MNILRKGALILILSFSFTASAQPVEYIDVDSNTTTGLIMHYCGVGLMSGLHVKKNLLLCNIVNVNAHSAGFNDYTTLRNGMHACPVGTAMSGHHVKNNVLKCNLPQNKTLDTNSEYVDTNGFREGMHACPTGWVMTGVHVKKNHVLCTKLN